MAPPWSSKIFATIGRPSPVSVSARDHVAKPLPVLARETLAVVRDLDGDDAALLLAQAHFDDTLAALGLRHGRDAFGGILDDVGEGLRQQATVEARKQRL